MMVLIYRVDPSAITIFIKFSVHMYIIAILHGTHRNKLERISYSNEITGRLIIYSRT